MTHRGPGPIVVAVLVLALGCGTADEQTTSTVASPTAPDITTTTTADPPLGAELVYFDADGRDRQPSEPPAGKIADQAGLDAFVARYVDGDPAMPGAATAALDAGRVLVGGVVSIGCFPAEGAELIVDGDDVRVAPVGLPDPEPDVECVRALTSIALFAVDPVMIPTATEPGS